MVKFTKSQIEFLKTVFPFVEEEFVAAAAEFVVKKKTVKPVEDDKRCCATKKDGERCTKKFCEGEKMCSVHLKNPPTDAVMKTEKVKCCVLTKKGGECRNYAVADGKCNRHTAIPQALSAEIVV